MPPSPQPWLKVVSWNSGPARGCGPKILGKLRGSGVAEEFDVILFQEFPGQWACPMPTGTVKDLLHQVFPDRHWTILVLHHLVTLVRTNLIDNPTQTEVRLFPYGSGKSTWWRFVQAVSCLGAESLRCGAFACCVRLSVVCVRVCGLKPCVCVLHLCVPVEHLRSAVPSTARGPRLSTAIW